MSELPRDVDPLLEHERARTELSPEELEATWSALRATVAAIDGGHGSGSGSGSGGAEATNAPAPATQGAASRAGSWAMRAVGVGATIAAFGAGVLVGRGMERSERDATSALSPTAATVSVPALVASSAPVDVVPAVPVASLPQAPPPPAAAAPSGRPAAAQPPAAPSGADSRGDPGVSSMAEERALVEGARTALYRGRAADALVLLQKHETRFAQGELAEDRDFLIVSALHDLGRTEEVRTRADAFVARYPQSALRGAVERMSPR